MKSGNDGKSVLNGTSNPTANDGAEGDFWINTTDNTIWGPKTATGWPSTGTDMIGANGTNGTNGDDGKSVLNGSSDPTSNDGAEGDFWINTTDNTIWGPKTATGWPSTGTDMIVLMERMAQMGMMVNLH